MNKDVSGSGMGVRVGSDAYQIVPVNGQDSIFQDYFTLINAQGYSDSLAWKMTAENNMDNYDDDTGISPGSYGTISFYVQPRDESINLDLSFSIVGYEYSEQAVTTTAAAEGGEESETTTTSENSEEPAETTTQQKIKTMTPVDDDLQRYLAGHIFLFQNREPVYDKPDDVENRVVVSYLYSDPILSGNDLSKVIRNRAFTKANQNTAVNIYWVWPKTLSTLVDVTVKNPNIKIEPFCDKKSQSYTDIKNNIINHPTYYFYNYSDSTTLTEDLMASQYDKYGDLYDRADNEIGMNVNYITLKMTTVQNTSAATTQATNDITTESE